MKILTITCHHVYNYGASLQAYALQQFLVDEGHEVQVINYRPQYLSFRDGLHFYIPQSVKDSKPYVEYFPMNIIYVLYRYYLISRMKNRKKAFDGFTKRFLHLTERYNNVDELYRDCPNADVFIAGSDQIWNSAIMLNGKDPAFYLDFASNKYKCISYAASFGANGIDENYRDRIKGWLNKLKAVSVRETSAIDILSTFNISSTVVLDPVFLLSANQWNIPSREYVTKPYLMVYNIGNINSQMINDAVQIAKNNGLMILSIKDTQLVKEADLNIEDGGPAEFVNLIKHADYILCNSFHGTAFSVMFNKQFYTYTYHSESNSSRMIQFLTHIGLMDRFNPQRLNSDIDYTKVNALLSELVDESKRWLIRNIND